MAKSYDSNGKPITSGAFGPGDYFRNCEADRRDAEVMTYFVGNQHAQSCHERRELLATIGLED